MAFPKTRRGLLFLVATAVLVIVVALFLMPDSSTPGRAVSLWLLQTNSINQKVFRITNGYSRAILLSDLIVETNSPTGWKAFSHTVPSHPQRLDLRETKILQIAGPTNQTWRLRVTYGTDVKGPALWLGITKFCIAERRWPTRDLGIMSGSNSCIFERLNN